MESVTKLGSCVLAVAAALWLTPSAFADSPSPPPGTPSIGQYVETVPTAKGGSTAGVGTAQSTHLTPAIEARLRELPPAIAQRLEAIATSSAYGAPQGGSGTAAGPGTGSGPVSAALTAVSGSSDRRVFWLLGAVIVVTTAMLWAAARRHRA